MELFDDAGCAGLASREAAQISATDRRGDGRSEPTGGFGGECERKGKGRRKTKKRKVGVLCAKRGDRER